MFQGRNVMSEIDFAAEVLPERTRVLAVTGTNGKSTVSTFAGQVSVQQFISYSLISSRDGFGENYLTV